jgi:hypothetical protein
VTLTCPSRRITQSGVRTSELDTVVIQLQISSLHVTGHVRLGDVWVAIILACTNQMATSCQVFANTEEVFYDDTACNADATKMAEYLVSQGVFAIPLCFEIGESA